MILVGLLMFVAAGLTGALFMIPTASPWFWPAAGALAVVAAAALLIPIRPRD